MDNEKILKEKGFTVVEVTPEKNLVGRTVSFQYTIVGLILRGSVIYEFNLETVKASAGMRLTFPHITMLSTLDMSPDFKGVFLVMTDRFALEALVGVETEKVQYIFQHTIRQITNKSELDLQFHLLRAIDMYQTFPVSSSTEQIAGSLFRDIILLLADSEVNSTPDSPLISVYTMADNYFRNFIGLVNKHVATEHEVAYYARLLNISSKYLGEVCKQKSGRKAKEIISAVLVGHLKREIAMSDKSLKVLAYEFGFSDQSSLGKFFRKMTGMSPRMFKRGVLNGDKI